MRLISLEQAGAALLLLSALGLAVARPGGSSVGPVVAAGGECAPVPLPVPTESITPQDLARRIANADGKVTVVDIRPEEAFANYHIPGAHNAPFERLAAGADRLPRPLPGLVVVCAADVQAANLAQMTLAQRGCRAVVLKGGIRDWWREVMTPGSIRGLDTP